MDPRKIYSDKRLRGICVYCGLNPETSDHVPSKVFLDEPYPENLPVVDACESCNNGFSLDEEYLACFIECVLAGTTDPTKIRRLKVSRILTEKPALRSLIESTRNENNGQILWNPDVKRMHLVLLKLARGHAAYECSEPRLDQPTAISVRSILTMSKEERRSFEELSQNTVLPEIGSRAFMGTVVLGKELYFDEGWRVVQKDRYMYAVHYSGLMSVRFLLGGYLACEVDW